MGDLAKRFDEEIQKTSLTPNEIKGLRSDYTLALKMGMAMGYKMAISDIQDYTADVEIGE